MGSDTADTPGTRDLSGICVLPVLDGNILSLEQSPLVDEAGSTGLTDLHPPLPVLFMVGMITLYHAFFIEEFA